MKKLLKSKFILFLLFREGWQMMAEKEYLTIYEASQVTGKCQNTIHRYIIFTQGNS